MTETETTSKIDVRNLYKVFGPNPDDAIAMAREGFGKDPIYRKTESVVAVNDVNLVVQPREIFVVMGLSGSGKSTFVRCLNRLFEPSQGQILVDGEDVLKANDEALRQFRLNKMTMVFQHFALFPHRTVVENVEYGLKIRGMEPDERRQKALSSLEVVGLDAWADSYPSSLSGGMQQRVGLARALAVDPDIMLMDEPFSALDPLIRRDMQEELIRIQHHFHTTIVFITHDLGEALKLGNQVAIMKDGRFVQVGTPEAIVNEPADEYVTAFTQDVDRSRVLSIGAIVKPVKPLHSGVDRVMTAWERFKAEDSDALFVVNGDGRVVGLALARDLAVLTEDLPIEDVMRRDFPEVEAEESIFEVYERCGMGLPLAVLDENGRLSGAVTPAEIFESLRTVETTAEPPPDLAPPQDQAAPRVA